MTNSHVWALEKHAYGRALVRQMLEVGLCARKVLLYDGEIWKEVTWASTVRTESTKLGAWVEKH
jgi:hypothetical protein